MGRALWRAGVASAPRLRQPRSPVPAEPQIVAIERAAESLRVPAAELRRWLKKGLVRKQAPEEAGGRPPFFDLRELRLVKAKLAGKTRPFRVLKRRGKASPYNAIELFAGCGGLALGMENAGLRAELLVEWDRDACATLRRNWPGKRVVEGDVTGVDFSAYRGRVDVVAGGFPCQAFSYAGEGRGFADTRGTMFFQFARCVDEVRPKIALGENVRGLLAHDGGRTLETMLGALRELGYRPEVRLLRAQFLDVPQKRERVVIVAVREDLEVEHRFPAESDCIVTLREALAGVPGGPGQSYSEAKAAVLAKVPEGGNWRDLPDELQRSYMKGSYQLGGGKTGMARRLAWDEPSLTLTCSPSQMQTERCHPEETRPLTVREYARVQTFPDRWEFAGGLGSRYRQIGNAVPVNLAYHVGRCLVAMLEEGGPPSAELAERQLALDL